MKEVVIRDKVLLLSERDVFMFQMAANDVSRAAIGEACLLSVRTVEGRFDYVRRQMGKKSIGAVLVELLRQKVIE